MPWPFWVGMNWGGDYETESVPLINQRDFLLEDTEDDGAPVLLLGFRNEFATRLT